MSPDEERLLVIADTHLADCPAEMREAVRKGLEAGWPVYGELDLARDERLFPQEAISELRDTVVYLCAELAWRDTPEIRDALRLTILAWRRLLHATER